MSQIVSLAEYRKFRAFARLSQQEKLAFVAKLDDEEALKLLFTWEAWARDKQLTPDGNWVVWLILAGRGFGKTRTGGERINGWAREDRYGRFALVGRTAADVRDVMVEGESGILACSPPWFMPKYEPSKRRLTWPNGAIATTYSADEPDALRGPQHTKAWCDEPAAWKYEDTWDQMMFGLRLGAKPQVVATTTPRPTRLIRMLANAKTTHVTRGTTYENKSNLSPVFWQQITTKYEGTRLGRQELEAILLDDAEGALWKRDAMIERYRVLQAPELIRVVVGVDPPASHSVESAECGIIVAGLGTDGHGYVLDDLSLQGSPNEWARQAVTGYYRYHADRLVAEVNQGGDMVEAVIRGIDEKVAFKSVRATRGKQLRAEPVAAIYEQGRGHHVGAFPYVEDQMCQWVQGDVSPDRLDALVWTFTELMVTEGEPTAQGELEALQKFMQLRQKGAA